MMRHSLLLSALILPAVLAKTNAAGSTSDGTGCRLELTTCRDSLALEARAAMELRSKLSKLLTDNTALIETVAELRRRVADFEAQQNTRPAAPVVKVVRPSAIAARHDVPLKSSSLPTSAGHRRRSVVSINTTYSVGCFPAGSSFDNPVCGCLRRPKPSQFDLRPAIKVVAGSW
jgi:hypothetical protein